MDSGQDVKAALTASLKTFAQEDRIGKEEELSVLEVKRTNGRASFTIIHPLNTCEHSLCVDHCRDTLQTDTLS